MKILHNTVPNYFFVLCLIS